MICPATRTLLLALTVAAVPVGAQTKRAPRRLVVTPELQRSAFVDENARVILTRAREARMLQDSALTSYDAKSFLRFSTGMGVHRIGPERLLIRTEQAARVRWARGGMVSVEPTGQRTGFPMGGGSLDLSGAAPIPYYPGRETLWIPASDMAVAKDEVDENDFLHPLTTGAEAYYRYETGDSVNIRLPDGKSIALRELRITARRADARAFVGSFWFDIDRGSLVRAAYRTSADLDLWEQMNDEMKREMEELRERIRTDTGKTLEKTKRRIDELDMGLWEKLGFKLAQGTFRPARARLSAVTIEYGLHEGRFWLPKSNSATGEIQAGFMKFSASWQESFQYDRVNGDMPKLPKSLSELGLAEGDTMYYWGGSLNVGGSGNPDSAARRSRLSEDSVVARYTRRLDSLRSRIDSARVAGDTSAVRSLTARAASYPPILRAIVRRRETCAHDSTYIAGVSSRYNGAVRSVVRLPCDRGRLATRLTFRARSMTRERSCSGRQNGTRCSGH